MWNDLIRAFKVTLLLAVILCGFYPLAVTAIGSVIFREQARGGILYRNGVPIGSKWIGQNFSKPEYFHGRPSAAGEKGYDAANSSGSNYGPISKKLADRVGADVERVLKENPSLSKGQVPVDLVTASGSGLDPHISPEAALVQVSRVAQARKLDSGVVQNLVARHISGPQLGFLGESTVNVLELNLALDEIRARE